MKGLDVFKRFELFVEEVEGVLYSDFAETKRYYTEIACQDAKNWKAHSRDFDLYLMKKMEVVNEMIMSLNGCDVLIDCFAEFLSTGIKKGGKKTSIEKFCEKVASFCNWKLVPTNKEFTNFKVARINNNHDADRFKKINKTICNLQDELSQKEGFYEKRTYTDLTSNKNMMTNAVKYAAPQKNVDAEKRKMIENEEKERVNKDVSIREINEDIENIKKMISEKKARGENVERLNRRMGDLYESRKTAIVSMRKTIPYANVGLVKVNTDPDLIDYGNPSIVKEILKMCIKESYNFDDVGDIAKYEVCEALKELGENKMKTVKLINDGFSNKQIVKMIGGTESGLSQRIDTIAKNVSEILVNNKKCKKIEKIYRNNLNFFICQEY